MKIREARKTDEKKLIALMQKADNRTFDWARERTKSFVLKNKDKMILVAEEKGNLIGFVGLKKYEDNSARKFADLTQFVWITWIAVLPEYRHKNIGSELLKFSEKYFNAYNKSGLILDCREKIIPFYVKNGYKIIGEYLDNNIPRYVLIKEVIK